MPENTALYSENIAPPAAPILSAPGDFWPIPDVSSAAFIAPGATVMGQITLGLGASIWYSAVLRGDVEAIRVGAYSNVQDGAVLHCDPGLPTVLEDYVTVGHRAVIHSAHVERGCLIGIGAILLNGVRVGSGSIVGAGALVTKDVPPRSLVVGMPAKVARPVSEAEAADLLRHAEKYHRLALTHAGLGKELPNPTGFG
ncbi:gamma carbonic anhydrase family protein [Leptolyngbya sp. PCC 6406]|uniref:gamma carbonic anhydrase family protein n=1 Tax=Leptolyngbya sp. PCC 6406 TaxID=1173264 RepID=UPI0002ABB83F|nr:gamma carbonic anhydrase family protein [Leptolyngbya sp. PCC 6406]